MEHPDACSELHKIPDGQVRIGCDVLQVSRLEQALARQGPGFADTLFCPEERLMATAQNARPHQLAHFFAVKESIMKALGFGLGQGLTPRMIQFLDLQFRTRLHGFAGSQVSARELLARSASQGEVVHALCLISPATLRPFALSEAIQAGQQVDIALNNSARLRTSAARVHDIGAIGKLAPTALERAFSTNEWRAQCGRKNRHAALSARLIAKRLAQSLLQDAGLSLELPTGQIEVSAAPGGKPYLRMPTPVVNWMKGQGLGMDLSLSHAGEDLMAAALLSGATVH